MCCVTDHMRQAMDLSWLTIYNMEDILHQCEYEALYDTASLFDANR